MKKPLILLGILLGLIALPVFAIQHNSGFKDIPSAAWYRNALDHMTELGVIQDQKGGNFRPNDAVNRAELVSILERFWNALGASGGNTEQITKLEAENRELRQKIESLSANSQSIPDLVERVKGAVVSIIETEDNTYLDGRLEMKVDPETGETYFEIPNQNNTGTLTVRQKVSEGSGFLYSPDGYIVTNKHVVSGTKTNYSVIFYDGSSTPAKVLARDTFNDIAVIKIDPSKVKIPLFSVPFEPLKNVRVGERVIAIGNATGLQNTVTLGIISALGRNIVVEDTKLNNLIQTDALINHGNSGGPLINLEGHIVGMNTVVREGTGIGFSIPADDFIKVANQVVSTGKLSVPYIGVYTVTLTKDRFWIVKTDIAEGAIILSNGESPAISPGSPAEKAGLKEKDIITAVDNEKVRSNTDFRNMIAKKQIGSTVVLTVVRGNKTLNIHVIIGALTS